MLEGCIRGIEDNWFQGRIADSAYELERRQNEGRRIVVGVNAFTEGNDDDADRICCRSPTRTKPANSNASS